MKKVVFYKTIFLVVVFYTRPIWRLYGLHKSVLKEVEVHVELAAHNGMR